MGVKYAGVEVVRTELLYDEVGRTRRALTVASATGEVLGDWQWTYDAAGQIREIALGHLGVSFRYEYNGRGERVGEETEGNFGGTAAPPYENQLGGAGRGWSRSRPTRRGG
ncbi:MAG TPA: hypothetical protein VNO22_01400 [Planctomycetota bacterium]|nr:hypothetical protein [Planctomycetota bacterium]